MELKTGCFSIEEELHSLDSLEEIENVAMWLTHENCKLQDRLQNKPNASLQKAQEYLKMFGKQTV